jgi:hypothetical protein
MADAEPTCPILARKFWTTHNELQVAIPSVVPVAREKSSYAVDIRPTGSGAYATVTGGF